VRSCSTAKGLACRAWAGLQGLLGAGQRQANHLAGAAAFVGRQRLRRRLRRAGVVARVAGARERQQLGQRTDTGCERAGGVQVEGQPH
jgi:hypothetical protein